MENATAAGSSQSNISRLLHLKKQQQQQQLSSSHRKIDNLLQCLRKLKQKL